MLDFKYIRFLLFFAILNSSCYEDINDLPVNAFEDTQDENIYFTFTDWNYDGWILKVYFESEAPPPIDYEGNPLSIAIVRDNLHWKTLSSEASSFSTNTFIATRRTCYQVAYVSANGELTKLSESLCLGN